MSAAGPYAPLGSYFPALPPSVSVRRAKPPPIPVTPNTSSEGSSKSLKYRLTPYQMSGNQKLDNEKRALILCSSIREVLLHDLKSKYVDPQLPKVAETIKSIQKGSLSFIETFASFKNLISKYISQFITSDTSQDLNRLIKLFFTLKVIFRIDINEIRSGIENKIPNAPEPIKPYLKPLLDCILTSIQLNKCCKLDQFISEESSLSEFKKNLPVKAVADFAAELILDSFLNWFKIHHDALNEIKEEHLTTESLQETNKLLIDKNVKQLSEYAILLVLGIISKLDLSELIHDALVPLKEVLKEPQAAASSIASKAKEKVEKKFYEDHSGTLVKIIFPETSLLDTFKKLSFPAQFTTPFNKIALDFLDRFLRGELTAEERNDFILVLKDIGEELLVFGAEKSLQHVFANELEKAFETYVNPGFIYELLGDIILPNLVNTLFVTVSLNALIPHLSNPVIKGHFECIDTGGELIIEVIANAWYKIVQTEAGLYYFSLKNEEIDSERFIKLVTPTLQILSEIIQNYKQSHKQKLNIHTAITEYLGQLFAYKEEHIPRFSDIVQTLFTEINPFDGSGVLFNWTVRPLVEKVGMHPMILSLLSKLILQSLPTGDELLTIIIRSLEIKYVKETILKGGYVERYIDPELLLGKGDDDVIEKNEYLTAKDKTNQGVEKVSQLAMDLINKSIKDATGSYNFMGIISGSASQCVTKETIEQALNKLIERLFSSKEKCQKLALALFELVIAHLSKNK